MDAGDATSWWRWAESPLGGLSSPTTTTHIGLIGRINGRYWILRLSSARTKQLDIIAIHLASSSATSGKQSEVTIRFPAEVARRRWVKEAVLG